MLVLCQGEVSTLLPLSFSHGADAFVIPDAAMVKIATFHTILQSWPADDGCVGYGSVSSFFVLAGSLALSLSWSRFYFLFAAVSSCLVLLLARWQQDSRSFAWQYDASTCHRGRHILMDVSIDYLSFRARCVLFRDVSAGYL